MLSRIALVGDHNPSIRAHQAIPRAVALAAPDTETVWMSSDAFQLDEFDGIWCVPGGPYRSFEGVLGAIRHARENGIPFLGTCGGFQHALIEYVRHALGYSDADHAESNPQAEMPVIAALACSLAGTRGTLHFKPGSRLSRIYGSQQAKEGYYCSYGINSQYRELLEDSDLEFQAFDDQGDPRAFELRGHPFFMGTLFQPELSALADSPAPHPLIAAFLGALPGRQPGQ